MNTLILLDDYDDDAVLLWASGLLSKEQERLNDPFHWKFPRFELQSFTEEECLNNFRFGKDDIPRLQRAMHLPEVMTSASRTKWNGLEGLCVVLRRLAYPNRLKDLVPIFGRSQTELSMIFNTTLECIYDEHDSLLKSLDLHWLSPDKLLEYAQAIEAKGSPLTNCWGFIDGTVRPICRPQHHQREVYNGHKRCHALKFQNIVAPNGLIAHLYGPFEGRRHDAAMLVESEVLPILDTA